MDWEALSKIPMKDGFIKQFNDQCAACHGEDLRGTPLGTPLVGRELRYGASVQDIARSIGAGFPDKGMPAWSETLKATQIWNLALYVAEQRQGTTILDKRADIPLAIPAGRIAGERHAFRIEVVAEGLDPLPFSIAPLADGRILLAERMRGLSIVERDGTRSPLIRGTPPVYADSTVFLGQAVQGLGWLLDVAPYPDFARERLDLSPPHDRVHRLQRPEPQVEAASVHESPHPRPDPRRRLGGPGDTGRRTRRPTRGHSDLYRRRAHRLRRPGHVFFSVGMKAPLEFLGIQDLSLPYGKIHRLHDDGRVPADNPFVKTPGALPSIWTYGHRSPQGLEWKDADPGGRQAPDGSPRRGRTEPVPPGCNYGWPLFTSGVNYDGRPVDVGKALGITLDAKDAEFPVLDLTPSRRIRASSSTGAGPFPVAGQHHRRHAPGHRPPPPGDQGQQGRPYGKVRLKPPGPRFRDIRSGPEG